MRRLRRVLPLLALAQLGASWPDVGGELLLRAPADDEALEALLRFATGEPLVDPPGQPGRGVAEIVPADEAVLLRPRQEVTVGGRALDATMLAEGVRDCLRAEGPRGALLALLGTPEVTVEQDGVRLRVGVPDVRPLLDGCLLLGADGPFEAIQGGFQPRAGYRAGPPLLSLVRGQPAAEQPWLIDSGSVLLMGEEEAALAPHLPAAGPGRTAVLLWHPSLALDRARLDAAVPRELLAAGLLAGGARPARRLIDDGSEGPAPPGSWLEAPAVELGAAPADAPRVQLLVPAGSRSLSVIARRLALDLLAFPLVVELVPLPPAEFAERLTLGDYQLAVSTLPRLSTQPGLDLAAFLLGLSALEPDEELTRMIRLLAQAPDPAARAIRRLRLEEQARTALPLLPLVHLDSPVRLGERVRGVRWLPGGGIDLSGAWLLAGP